MQNFLLYEADPANTNREDIKKPWTNSARNEIILLRKPYRAPQY